MKLVYDVSKQELARFLEEVRDHIIYKFKLDRHIPEDVFSAHLSSRILEVARSSYCIRAFILKEKEIQGAFLCSLSKWDTEHFGFRVAKTVLLAFKRSIGMSMREALIVRGLKLCREAGVRVVFTRVPLSDPLSICALEQAGSYLTDVLLTFYIDLGNLELVWESSNVRELKKGDEEAIKRIAFSSFKLDHFHNDPKMPKRKASELFEKWVESYFDTERQKRALLIAEHEDVIAGFITCKVIELKGWSYGVIDLIAVSEEFRGRGVGKALVKGALTWLARYTSSVYVGTQASNIAAVRLYEGAGFRCVGAEATLHSWLD